MIDRFTRERFEKVLGQFPLAYKVTVDKGQLVYRVPIASKITCPRCHKASYPARSSGSTTSCPYCGYISGVSSGAVRAGELYLTIYSSINPQDGMARETGQDSIRVVLSGTSGHSKVARWTTRVKGWETRLLDVSRQLWRQALDAPRCSRGHKATMYVSHTSQNNGRQYWKCQKCQQWLGWVD